MRISSKLEGRLVYCVHDLNIGGNRAGRDRLKRQKLGARKLGGKGHRPSQLRALGRRGAAKLVRSCRRTEVRVSLRCRLVGSRPSLFAILRIERVLRSARSCEAFMSKRIGLAKAAASGLCISGRGNSSPWAPRHLQQRLHLSCFARDPSTCGRRTQPSARTRRTHPCPWHRSPDCGRRSWRRHSPPPAPCRKPRSAADHPSEAGAL